MSYRTLKIGGLPFKNRSDLVGIGFHGKHRVNLCHGLSAKPANA